MSTVGWLLVVAVGIALGFSAGRLWPGSAARVTALERERNTAREDLQKYRNDVGQHFERTAELFDKVTTDYRDLYEHLARSERQLGAIHGESSGSSLAQPEQRRLAANAAAAATAATAAEAVTPSAAADETVTEDETTPSVASEEKVPENETAPSVEAEDTVPEDEKASDPADEKNTTRPGA